MATDPNFTPLVEALLPGTPENKSADLPGIPDVTEADIIEDSVLVGAIRVTPTITSAKTGG